MRTTSLASIALVSVVLALAGCEDDPWRVFATGAAPEKQPPAHVAGGFSIAIPPVTLLPGQERSPCYIFPIELEGSSHFVGGGSLSTGPGVHHGNITTRPRTGEGVRPCPDDEGILGSEAGDVVKGGTVLFASSTQIEGEEWLTFPEGTAFRIPARDLARSVVLGRPARRAALPGLARLRSRERADQAIRSRDRSLAGRRRGVLVLVGEHAQ
jgi:hypothetical protein